MISCHLISDLQYIWCHTGAYFRFDWDLPIFMESPDHSHLWDVYRDDGLFDIFAMIPQWSLFLAIQLGSHFSTFRCYHASPSRRRLFDLWVWFSYGCRWLGSHFRWQMIWAHLIFWPSMHLMPYWDIFPFRLRFVDPRLWDTRQVDDSISFCPDSPLEPFLSHFIRLILSDIVVILGLSYFKYIDSHIIILARCMSDLLYIPMELFSNYQNRPGTFDAILGHILSFSYGDDRSLADLLHFSSLNWEILYFLYRSLFLWFPSRWAFSGAWHSGCDCLTIHDPAIDCFDEIVVVTPTDYSLETP